MTFLTSSDKRTLPVGIVKLQSTAMYKTDWGALFAGLVIIMVPSVIIYAIFNRQLQSGMNAGGIKG
jgi:N-acetylglucosamine transport system permease protein